MSDRRPLSTSAPIELVRQFRFQWEPAQSCHVLLYPEGMVKLNQSGGEIMTRCDGQRSIADIVGELQSTFPGVDLRADVIEFLEVAHGKGWIREKPH